MTNIRSAFSLVEVLIVVVILGILAAIMVPRIIGEGGRTPEQIRLDEQIAVKQKLVADCRERVEALEDPAARLARLKDNLAREEAALADLIKKRSGIVEVPKPDPKAPPAPQ